MGYGVIEKIQATNSMTAIWLHIISWQLKRWNSICLASLKITASEMDPHWRRWRFEKHDIPFQLGDF